MCNVVNNNNQIVRNVGRQIRKGKENQTVNKDTHNRKAWNVKKKKE